MQEKYSREAIAAGLEYLGGADEILPAYYRKYRHINCKHIENLIPANVRAKQVACKICVFEKHTKEAADQGLKILRKFNTTSYNYLLPCQHEQSIHISAVRTGEWMCRECNESYFSKPSQLYLLRLEAGGFSWLKMGYTNNLKVRVRSYKLSPSVEVKVIKLVNLSSGREAIHLEQKLHSKYFNYRLNPGSMKRHHKQDGYTECYPVSMIYCLLDEFNQIEKDQNETT